MKRPCLSAMNGSTNSLMSSGSPHAVSDENGKPAGLGLRGLARHILLEEMGWGSAGLATSMAVRRKLRHVGSRSDSSHHVLCDRGLADLNAELQQLALDARHAPQWFGAVHLPDEITNFVIYRWPSRP
jgi:hypothetical protein